MTASYPLLAVLLGVSTWSFLEYVIHRWLGHERSFRGNLFGIEHKRHHFEGDYFAPLSRKAPVAAGAAIVLAIPAVLIAGPTIGLSYVAGLIGFYLVYEVLHRREHTHPGLGAYGRWARRHHFFHHFVDARRNHGVTSPIWDFVFGTYTKPTIIKVPARLCMPWLTDPQTGEIRPEHADSFALAKERRAS